ncbi:MAG: hypothetical protein JWN02_332 [Acidobacteria bacterium]|nr:hypothetical protein [Acidobacteriota bacterium]
MAEGNVATPFLEMRSFVREEAESFPFQAAGPPLGSPFLSVYELDGQSESLDPEQEAFSTLVQDLYDEEFDEALFELMVGARGLHEEHLASSAQSLEGERLLNQHFSQLIREMEESVSAFERQFGTREPATLGDAELEAFAEGYSPATTLNPEFEEFFGKWKKKLVGWAKKAGKSALKLGLGPVLNKIKALVKPLLNKVLQLAIGRLPEALRPAAEQLADRVFHRMPKSTEPGGDAGADPSGAASAAQAPAGPSVTDIQQELDKQLANLLLASDGTELEQEVAKVRADDRGQTVPVYADLDQARERFISELEQLGDGEDATPHIQNFLPAVLPALRTGIRLIGRARVVGFLAKLLAKLVSRLIGPESAPALSRAIVDAGLKLLTLEVSPQDQARAAASSVAATVEETVRRVSALPGYVLDDPELLEGFAMEAFEQAAAANLPPVLSEAVYRGRPELLESQSARTCWVMLPLRRRKRYKKCARTFKVRISPYLADEIESFEGPLADYLQDQLGLEEGMEVEAEVSLYETLPGTTLPDIAREESETAAMTAAGTSGAAQLHPLTPEAAGLLLGEPRMGRDVPAGTDRRSVGPGQRFYRLSITGRRPLNIPGPDGRPHPRGAGAVRVALDCPRDEIRVRIYLSEVKAQRLAGSLKRQSHQGALAAALHKFLGRRLAPVLRGEQPSRLRVRAAGLSPGEGSGVALQRLPEPALAALTRRLQEAVVRAFAAFVKEQSQRFIAAVDEPADGVTLKFTIVRPAGLQPLGKALLPGGSAAGLAGTILGGAAPEVRVEVFAGNHRG